MPGTLEDFAAAIRDIIGTCRDAEQGFRAAADAVTDPLLKDLFEQYSRQRAGFADEIQEAVKAMGFETAHPSGVGGVVHGAWMTIKGLFTGHSDVAILEETERGEDWSVKAYRKAMDVTMPSELRPLIERQYEQVLVAHDHIKALRDARRSRQEPPPPVQSTVAPPVQSSVPPPPPVTAMGSAVVPVDAGLIPPAPMVPLTPVAPVEELPPAPVSPRDR